MQSGFRIFTVVALATTLTACQGPIGFASGGELTGTETDAPETWQLPEPYAFAQLETRPEDPYSVNIAYVQLDARLYVYAGNTRTNWVKHIEDSPLVRILIDETIYAARAVRVNDDDELTVFAAEWTSRSVFQRDPLQFEEVWLYRLEAR